MANKHMTPEERQQSLAAARRACEWLEEYLQLAPQSMLGNLIAWESVRELMAGFEILDAKEQAQVAAGEHGHRGGRPKKTASTADTHPTAPAEK
jgi:hypothetical protein